MKMAKFSILMVLIIFNSNCFGAKAIQFNQIGCTISVGDDGQVICADGKNTVEIPNTISIAKEVFKITDKAEHEGCFAIFPIGYYRLCDLNSNIKYKQKEFEEHCSGSVGEYYFYVIERAIVFAKKGDTVICKYSINFDFDIGFIVSDNDSLTVYSKNFLQDGILKLFTLNEIETDYILCTE